jgi:hypothetical protein
VQVYQLGTVLYADATHPGWGYIAKHLEATQAAAIAVTRSSQALTGLSKNIALGATGAANGAERYKLENFAITAVRIAVMTLPRSIAYDEATKAYLERLLIWSTGVSATTFYTYTPASAALTGLSKNIALGAERWGGYKPFRYIPQRLGGSALYSIAGVLDVQFGELQAANGFAVAGVITLAVSRVGGTVTLQGAFSHVGQLLVLFTPPSTSTFEVAGELLVEFGAAGAADSTCIAPSDAAPAPGRPQNSAY